jgi:hypothetical protein
MAGRVSEVGACSTRPMLRSRFSWCWMFGFLCLNLYILVSFITAYLLVAALSHDFLDFVDEVSSTLFTTLAYGHCCNLREVFLTIVPVLVLRLLPCCNPLWGSVLSMKVLEICSKKKKQNVIIFIQIRAITSKS